MQQEKRRLTREQDELRESGLRILARLIARRCLDSLAEEEAAGSQAPGVRAHSDRRPRRRDDGHVR